jgi:flagellar assembly protein FliH
LSNKPFSSQQRQQTFKQVDVGQRVVLNDEYLMENHKSLQLETIALRTMQNAEERANELLEASRNEAQQILAAAREKALQIVELEGIQQRDAFRQQAYEEGFQAGLQEGYLQISQEAADKVRMAELIVQKAFEAEALVIKKQQAHYVALLEHILKLVLLQELETKPEHMIALIEKAAEQIQYTGTAKIIVHPETLQTLKSYSAETMAALSELHHIRFHPDAGCSPYELYLETVECAFNISAQNQAEIYLKAVSGKLDFTEDVVEEALTPAEKSNDEPEIPGQPVSIQGIRQRIGMLVPIEEDEEQDTELNSESTGSVLFDPDDSESDT